MILNIPYNPALPCGYDKLVAAILKYGRHPAHTLFVTALAEHEDGAFAVAMKLREHFGRYFAITVPKAPYAETPTQASNRVFRSSLDALREYVPAENENPEPVMLYFDPVWRPVKARWLDEFQADYYLAGTPVTYGHWKAAGPNARVEGPVAISRQFLKKTKLIDFMPQDAHWREFLAWEMIKEGLQAEALGRTLPAYIRPYDT